MTILPIDSLLPIVQNTAAELWEENMVESWSSYNGADMFVVEDNGNIIGGFAVYHDKSDGIEGLFCSGWTARHSRVPSDRILQKLVDNVGDVYFKTAKRPAKFLLEKIAKKVKTTDRFGYYVIRGNKNGTTK